jgi:hypothetical protein
MDPTRFDHLARALGRAGGRRAVLGALLGALLGTATVDVQAKKQRKGKGKDRDQGKERERDHERDRDRDREQDQDRGKDRLQAQGRGKGKGKGKGKQKNKKKKKRGGGPGGAPPADCCGTIACAPPTAGSLRDECDYAEEDFAGLDLRGAQFEGIDGRQTQWVGADLRGVHFTQACLQSASFRRALLHGALFVEACLFGADFTGADLGGDGTLSDDARFCDTILPDGSTNDRDCDQPTPCCQRPGPPCQRAADCAAEACRTVACTNGQCLYTVVADGADPSGACTHCCEGVCCQGTANQCNLAGLCCAPNCAGRECGPDGCGRGGTCGPGCRPGQTCDEAGQCTGTPTCSPQTCSNGCCADSGACQPGNANTVCGRGGTACQDCTTQSQVCGGGGTPGVCGCASDATTCAGKCGSVTNNCGRQVNCSALCPGCCDNQGVCQPGNDLDVCGAGGAACQDCIFRGFCVDGRCQCTADVCPEGCCDNGPGNAGECIVNSPGICGVGGEQCFACQSGQHCCGRHCCDQGHACCDPGCCAPGLVCCGGACIDVQTDARNCGACGNACAPGLACCDGTCCDHACCGDTCCDPGESCCGGVCVSPEQGCCGGTHSCCGPGIAGMCCGENSDICCHSCDIFGPPYICCPDLTCGQPAGSSCQFPGSFDNECCSKQCDNNSRCT